MPGYVNGVRYVNGNDPYALAGDSREHAKSDAQQALDAANDALLGAKAYTDIEIANATLAEGAIDVTDSVVGGLIGTGGTATRTQVDGRVSTLAITKAGHDAAVAALVDDDGSALRGELTRSGALPVGRGELVRNVLDYGAIGNGTANDTAAIQAALNAGGTVFIPDGIYSVSGLTVSSNDATVTFSQDAWLKPTSGYGLTVTAERVKMVAPKIRIDGGSPSGGIRLAGSTRSTITDPVVWAFSAISGTVDAIVVDAHSYWCTVTRPHIRKNMGALSGQFRRGVAFLDQSNAGVVLGGDFAHCGAGVYVHDTNSTLVVGSAFEAVAHGVHLDGSVRGAAGSRVMGTRFENVTNCVHISSTVTTIGVPLMFSGFSPLGVSNEIVQNPNGVPYTIISGARVHLGGNAYGYETVDAGYSVATTGAQTENAYEATDPNGNRSWGVNKYGDNIYRSVSSTWPSQPDVVGVVRHYAYSTWLATVDPASTAGSVFLGVGDGSGGVKPIAEARNGAFRAGGDNTESLGTADHRWSTAHIGQAINLGGLWLRNNAGTLEKGPSAGGPWTAIG